MLYHKPCPPPQLHVKWVHTELWEAFLSPSYITSSGTIIIGVIIIGNLCNHSKRNKSVGLWSWLHKRQLLRMGLKCNCRKQAMKSEEAQVTGYEATYSIRTVQPRHNFYAGPLKFGLVGQPGHKGRKRLWSIAPWYNMEHKPQDSYAIVNSAPLKLDVWPNPGIQLISRVTASKTYAVRPA